jgi:hypothetical protein
VARSPGGPVCGIIGRTLSSHWLRAAPRALRAYRIGQSPVTLAALIGLVTVGGCDVSARSSPGGTSASSGTNGSADGAAPGIAGDAASSCHASDVQTYVSSGTYQAAAAPSDACLGASDAEAPWSVFYDLCFGLSKSKALCSAFEQAPASAACAACILTPFTAMRPGPILDYGGFVGGNVPGCIEVTGAAPDTVACASAFQALSDCELAACQANCPVSDSASLAARELCSMTADQTGCKSYDDHVHSACLTVPAEAACTMDTSFQDFYNAIVPLFCAQPAPDGGGPDDAGAPAADAGVGDAGVGWPARDGASSDAGSVPVDAPHD